MKKILINLLLCFIPGKNLRKRIRLYFSIKSPILPPAQKFFQWKENQNEITTLIFGSSHGLYGYHAEGSEFNLCDVSQDLYYSYHLYALSCDFPQLKTVIFFYSVFSPGHMLEKTAENLKCLFYKELYHIPYRFLPDNAFSIEKWQFDKFMRTFELSSDPSKKNGNCEKYTFFPATVSAEERVTGHLKNNKRKESQNNFISQAARLAAGKGHRFVIVIPPFRSDYCKCLPASEEMFSELLCIMKQEKNIELINFINDPDFTDTDFGDTDHLTLDGALKLTKKIRDKLDNSSLSNKNSFD